jgi:hypothetical protein
MAESVLDKHIADELHDRLIAEATKIAADGGSDDA